MLLNLLKKLKPCSDFGLVINWKFHKENGWCVAITPYLIDAIIKEFRPVIINNQDEYDKKKDRLRHIISVEPGWAAPVIKYDTSVECKKAVFYSDPHLHTEERKRFFLDNDFDYVFSYYKSPFFYHLKDFPKEKFIHMPWAIPDEFIENQKIKVRSNKVVIFGGKGSDAYDVRNWCRVQKGIKNYNFSGVENKQLVGKNYFKWLRKFDAIVAAGSSDPKYNLVTPKYFEIASSGALLLGQYCKDLEDLGFNKNNCIIFTKDDFNANVRKYKASPKKYLNIREAGRELIRSRHKISDRIKLIKETLFEN